MHYPALDRRSIIRVIVHQLETSVSPAALVIMRVTFVLTALALVACGAATPLRAKTEPLSAHTLESRHTFAGDAAETRATALADTGPKLAKEERARKKAEDAAIVRKLIQDSIDAYAGNCPCPYHSAKNGSSCGKRSAYSRAGGAEVLCYARDVTPDMVQKYRQRYGEVE